MALDPRMILSGRQTPGSVDVLGNLSRGMAVGSQIQGAQRANQARMAQQQKSEQLSDIFARNVQIDPATGVQGLNKPQALAELYQIDPQMGLQFEKQWVGPGKSIGELALKQRKLDFEGTKLTSKEKLFGDRLAFDEKKLAADMKRLKSGDMTGTEKRNFTSSLRKEFVSQNKTYKSVGDAYSRINASRGIVPSGQSDMSLVFNFMKMLDPASTVREGEFKSATLSGGMVSMIQNFYDKVKGGILFKPEVRQGFFDQVDRLYNQAENRYSESRKVYTDLAVREGVDPLNVVIDLGGRGKVPSKVKTAKPVKKVKRAKSDKSLLTEYDF